MAIPNMVYWSVAQTRTVVPNAIGTHGTGKSRQAEAFAGAIGHGYYGMVLSFREPTDLGGFPYPDMSNGRKVMRFMMPDWLDLLWAEHDKGVPYVLHLDEGTSCNPAVQTAMMRVVHDRKVGENPLPESTITIMSCNPPGIAANGFEFEPPMANRMCHLPWETDWATWERGMGAGMRFAPPQFPILPADWHETHLPKWANLVGGYRQRKPSAFELSEQDIQERTKLGGPHPSMRSWTNGGISCAAVEACDGSQEEQFKALSGCVGDIAAQGFFDWLRELDLPDPEETLQKAIAANKAGQPFTMELPPRCDQIMVFLGAVTERVRQQKTRERFEGADSVYCCVAKGRYRELAAACGSGLISVIPEDARLSKTFVDVILPMLRDSGYCQ